MRDTLGPWAKSFPPSSWGMTPREFLVTESRLSAFATPLLTIDASATAHNVAVMAEWLIARGLEIAPHGKTTMAPQLWRQLLDAGAWGITLATGWQVQLARSFGIRRVILANEFIDPVGLHWLGVELADPSFEFACWVDSVESIELMRAGLTGAARPVDVIVELGGARTGARTVEAALAVAAAVEAAPELRLAGLGGYEGSLAHDRSPAAIGSIERYLDDVVTVHGMLAWQQKPIVTAAAARISTSSPRSSHRSWGRLASSCAPAPIRCTTTGSTRASPPRRVSLGDAWLGPGYFDAGARARHSRRRQARLSL